MVVNSAFVISVAVLLGLVRQSTQYTYIASAEDEEIFIDCTTKSPNTQNVHAIIDMSNINISLNANSVVTVSGYAISLWNVNANSKIEAKLQFMRFERGMWMPTAFAMKVPDLCREMYNENQYWYKALFQYVDNIAEMRDKCLEAGTLFKINPFEVRFEIETNLNNMDGRYKMLTTFREVPPTPQEVCFEIEFAVVRK